MASQSSDLIQVPEMDDALIMELLDESYSEEVKDDRLGCLIRSLEAEIGAADPSNDGSGTLTLASLDPNIIPEDSGLELEEKTQGLHSHDNPEDTFHWMQMEEGHGDDMCNWYVDGCMDDDGILVEKGDASDYHALYNDASSLEQTSSPLWH